MSIDQHTTYKTELNCFQSLVWIPVNSDDFIWFLTCSWRVLCRLLQSKLTDLQNSKKEIEGKVENMRTIKETAEEPEKEAKERHLKAWEGKCSCLALKLWLGLAAIIMLIYIFLFDHYSVLQETIKKWRINICTEILMNHWDISYSEWLYLSAGVSELHFLFAFLCYRTKSSDPCGKGQS